MPSRPAHYFRLYFPELHLLPFLRVSILGGGGCTPPGQTPPPEMATVADGTHPSGMHSLFYGYKVFFLEG